jgi:hypothetical protein
MNWVEKLQEILAREAQVYFEAREIARFEFEAYVKSLTSVHDWDEDFLEECYNKYMEKVNSAGAELTDKMTD